MGDFNIGQALVARTRFMKGLGTGRGGPLDA